MEIKQNMKIHNRYDIEIKDAVSGKIKQKAVAYNVVCDGYFRLLLDGDAHILFNFIAFGQGTGTPATSDSGLFNEIGRISTTDIETVYQYPTSHRTVQIILNADSYNGSTITEVGIFGADTTYYGSPTYLVSHALIQDSEGQQIAITKTNTDVVYITATFYVTFTPSGFGDNGIYPVATSNDLIKFALGTTWTGYTNNTNFYACPTQLTNSNELSEKYTYSKYIEFRASGNQSQRTLTLSTSILSEEGGTQTLRTIGFPTIGAFSFPDASVMSQYSITNKTIGTGDGETTDFNLGVPYLKSGSVSVYVDDVLKTEGTDYTIDYSSNDTDNFGNYESSKLSFFRDTAKVKWGDAASRSPAGYFCYDPVGMLPNEWTINTLPRYCDVDRNNPIWFDFLSAKECNTVKLFTIPSGQADNLIIEYSNDNQNWTAVEYTRNNEVYKFALTSARYWRAYFNNYQWSYDFSANPSVVRDGVSEIYAIFFLGKCVPALHFLQAPASGSVITSSYDIDIPYKTGNNIIRVSITIVLNRD